MKLLTFAPEVLTVIIIILWIITCDLMLMSCRNGKGDFNFYLLNILPGMMLYWKDNTKYINIFQIQMKFWFERQRWNVCILANVW